MSTKAKFTEDDIDRVEAQIIPLLTNEPSGRHEVEGYSVVFKRPKLIDKYKARIWSNKQLKELDIETPEEGTEESNMQFYFRFLGVLNLNVSEMYLPDGTQFKFDKSLGYQFLLEQFLEEELNKKFKDDDKFIDTLTNVYVQWVEDSTPKEADIKNS